MIPAPAPKGQRRLTTETPMTPTTTLRTGALLAGVGVALGAFGAHGLEALLAERGTLATWNTAVHYHLVHALALCGCALLPASRAARCAAWSFAAGAAVFSGSLYVLATLGPKWLGAITPIGGVAFLVGWVAVAVAAAGLRPQAPQNDPTH